MRSNGPSEVPEQVLIGSLFALTLVGAFFLVLGRGSLLLLDGPALLMDSFKYSLPLTLLVIFFGYKALTYQSPFSRQAQLLVLLALFGVTMSTYGAMALYNRYQNQEASSAHEAEVLSKSLDLGLIRRMPDGAKYFLQVASWRPGAGTERIQVYQPEYQMAVPGKTRMIVDTRPGALGYEWIESQEVLL